MYMAPDCQHKTYSFPSDVWAFGVLMTRMLSGQWPYPEDMHRMRVLCQVYKKAIKPRVLLMDQVGFPEVLDIVNGSLEFDPRRRPTFRDIEERLTQVVAKMRAAEHDRPGTFT